MSDNHENEKPVNDEDDSDPEDFGGFEAAEPVIPNVAQVAPSGVEAGPSPWAYVGAGSTSVGVRPDLLCGQNRFPPLLDPTVPAVPNGTDVVPVENDICQSAANGGATFQANFDANFPDVSSAEQEHTPHTEFDDATFADDILDGSFRSTASSHSGASSGQFGNISGNTSNMQQSGAVGVKNSSQSVDLELSKEQTVHQVINNPSEHGINKTETISKNHAILPDNVSGAGGLQVIEVDEMNMDKTLGSVSSASLNDAQSIHSKIESQLTNNVILTKSVEIVSSSGGESLSQRSQKLPMDSVDSKAENQLTTSMFSNAEVAKEFAAARKESHDALNVVIEEYKALMKSSHLELQEASKQSLQQILKEQQAYLQLQNQQQETDMEVSMKEKKKQMEEDMLAMMKEQSQDQKVEFEKFLQEEKEKNQALLENLLKEEREASQKKIQETVEEERENTTKLLLHQKEQFENLMKEERDKFAEETASLLDSERKKFTEILHQAVLEEREKNKEAVVKVMALAKEEVQSHIQQQKQLDKAVRQKQMASLDIFLESAQRQLAVLMTENVDSISQEKGADSS